VVSVSALVVAIFLVGPAMQFLPTFSTFPFHWIFSG
jgi:hypothetical protein